MANGNNHGAGVDPYVFVVTRVFAAPRELVYAAWTEPDRLSVWWGPVGFVLTVLKMELRPGGEFLYGMRSAEGYEMFGKFTYLELNAPGRTVSLLSFSDRDGVPVRHPMAPHWPLETLNTMTLSEENGMTTLTLSSTPHHANQLECDTFLQGHASMVQGFSGTFNQLESYLSGL